jgi:hypothetical protein
MKTINFTWQDTDTGLMWEHYPYNDNKTFRMYGWYDAFDHVAQLNKTMFAGYSDWRLPSIDELATLGNVRLYRMDKNDDMCGEDNSLNEYSTWNEWEQNNLDKAFESITKNIPEICDNNKVFIKKDLLQNTKYQTMIIYWSSNTFIEDYTQAFIINFNMGISMPIEKDGYAYIKCVRGDLKK